MLRALLSALIFCLLSQAAAQPAQERRVALVIGIEAYTVGPQPLTHPREDAETMHRALTGAGFDAGEAPLLDPDLGALGDALIEFRQRAQGAGVAVIYFAGHGVVVDGETFLVPAGATLEREHFVYTEALRLQDVVRLMSGARARIVFLDACRNNPWEERWGRPRTRAAADGGGLPVLVPPEGVLMAYAAAALQTARDDGVYARVLASHIGQEGVELRQMLDRVGAEVARARGDSPDRAPTYESSLDPAPFHFVPGLSEEDRFWQTFQADINGGRCAAARADLDAYARRVAGQQALVNVVVTNVLPTCRQTTQVSATRVEARPEFLASLVASDRAALTRADYEALAARLDVEWEALAAVVEISSGRLGAYDPNGRPIILFERHLFSRKTERRYDASHPHVSSPQPGGYPRSQDERWAQLAEAYALDAEAALQSASYGRFQLLGQNFSNLSMDNAHDYVARLVRSERDQLDAFVAFVQANGLVDELQRKDWAGFASGYFGPGYAQNGYDTRMAEVYARLRAEL